MFQHNSNECRGKKSKILSKMKLWQNWTWGQTQNLTNYNFFKRKWQKNQMFIELLVWQKM